MTKATSSSAKTIVAKIKATQKLKRDDKKIINSLALAIKANSDFIFKNQADDTSTAYKEHIELQTRIIDIMTEVVSIQKLEILLQSEIAFINGEIQDFERKNEIENEPEGTFQEVIGNRKQALLKAEDASMLLAIRQVPEAINSPLSVMRGDMSYRPAPWTDSVTEYCAFELAYLIRYLPYSYSPLSSTAPLKIFSLRKQALEKFLHLYLYFRNTQTPRQTIQ